MKKILFATILLTIQVIIAQQGKGIIKGVLTDKETNNEPLPFGNVFIKGTTIGTSTDFDGNYTLKVPAGAYTIVFSFVGYKTIEKLITVKGGETIIINQTMGASEGIALEEVKIEATVNKGKETALLLAQKKASVIIESIGAQELAKKGLSDAATATTKISGVIKSEGTGYIYIRGLGDRYLSTSMNSLPIPSDNVENKNINLNLFSTNVIQNIGISKTYATHTYADQASGSINIISKEFKKGYFIGVSGGSNTNVINNFSTFRKTLITNYVRFGFYKKKYALVDLITLQGWDTQKQNTPLNYALSFSVGEKLKLFNKDIKVFATASHSKSFSYQKGIFKSYRANVLNTSFTDTQTYNQTTNTTGYIRANIKLNDYNKIKYNTLFVTKGIDNLYKQGRNGDGYVFDQDPEEDGAFVRDQNYKQTNLFINQFLGEHWLSKKNKLNWGVGYNFVLAEEPNRIRNEVNILNETTVEYANVGDFQQRKSSQKIQDKEYNGFIKNQINFNQKDSYQSSSTNLNYGFNFRHKERIFKSQFIGVRARGIQVNSIDNLSSTFTPDAFNNGLTLRKPKADTYIADLNYFAGFVNMDFKLKNNISGNIGFRLEKNQFNVLWDIGNFVGRRGSLQRSYNNIYPSVNLKYQVNKKSFIRFASSATQTLPEFKELAPFEYVSPTNRITRGNPNLEKSEVYNYDLKYEFFPSKDELFSMAAFYKQIKKPINLTQARGSAGVFEYANTGKEATVFGVELEGKLSLLKNEDEQTLFSASTNLTKMWFNQDLAKNYQYKNKTESNLQGAADFILNTSLSYNNRAEKEFIATLTANYSSDKLFALGNPEDFTNSVILYNDEIIEKGFLTLDVVVSKKINQHLSIKLIGKNLANPSIKQTQLVRDINTKIETNQIVSAYKKGAQISVNFSYNF